MGDAPLPAWRLSVPAVAAHRGGKAEGPENTLYGMAQGLAHGATHLEVDVRATADGIPVCIHDATAQRTCLDPRAVDEMTAREVRTLDPCALWSELRGIATGEATPPQGYTPRWFQVPTLDDVLRAFPGVPIILDLKDTAPVASVANVVKAWGRTSDLLLAGYDDEVLNAAAELLPETPRGGGVEGTQAFFEGSDTPADAIVVPLEHEGIGLVDREYVEEAHDQGKAFWVWTINELDVARELMEMGVDGVITDVPRKLSRLRLARLAGEG